MSSPAFLASFDETVRREAIDPTRSFTVRAPAGSGKTELLIQRYLRLLAVVERPEAIVAITFTKKAAGEMLGRITKALRDAALPAAQPHQELSRQLARAAAARDREMGWNLLQHPGRLRVQTIDSLCVAIAGEMPWVSRLGAMPRIEEDARVLYAEAARRTLLTGSPGFDEALEILLEHLDNNAARARDLISGMLAKRDQWLELAFGEHEREALEKSLARTVTRRLRESDALIPVAVRERWVTLAIFGARNREDGDAALLNLTEWPAVDGANLGEWKALGQFPLTGEKWRKTVNKNHGFMPKHPAKNDAEALFAQLSATDERMGGALRQGLRTLSKLPPPHYTDAQWRVLSALLQTLRLAVGQLALVFQERRTIDFCELGIAARRALGAGGNPTDLAYRLDSRIQHLLIDEFQDTSRSQFDLVKQLTEDWQEGDGRTLFLVADPMQSIYRFRQAEVGLFLQVEKFGLGPVRLKPLGLTMNHRSRAGIVERVNRLFGSMSPERDDTETGAIAYTSSQARPEVGECTPKQAQLGLFDESPTEELRTAVTWDFFAEEKDEETGQMEEARSVLQRIEQARGADPRGSIAILVRARPHLNQIILALKTAGIRYRAFEIDPLAERPAVRDVLSLTRALLHLADRISWLAILRAPWCGLTLGDLERLVRPAAGDPGRHRKTVWECLRELSPLTGDGRARAERVREVLTQAFMQQGRWPLRQWVERTWIALGGPAAIAADEQAREDVAVFFDLLEQEQRGADLLDLEQFSQRVALVKERPPSETSDGGNDFPPIDVMTIHKAKGLEFDTVIVPGLGQGARQDDADLVLFHEWAENGGDEERLMAPISKKALENAHGADPEGVLYSYLKMIDGRKEGQERARQLYVAMTRAKRRLHMLGVVQENSDGQRKPRAGTMLAQIWPWLAEEERLVAAKQSDPGALGSTSGRNGWSPRRLPSDWSLPEPPAQVNWKSPNPLLEVHEPSFEWVRESLRHAGTVVHAFLQSAAPGDLTLPDMRTIHARLRHAGVSPAEIDGAARRVRQALARTFESERGRWILAQQHRDARSEYSLAAVVDGEVVRGLVDRTFVDQQGVRWIVDFKTSSHEGAGLEKFLDEQQRRYRDQMERYARILRPLGNPVRVGLYFPLLDEWREWTPE